MTLTGSGSPGQVAYWVDTEELSGSDDHFWDETYKRLGIGTDSPECALHVIVSGTQVTVSAHDVAVFQNNGETSYDANVRILAGSQGKATLQFGYATSTGLQSISCDNYNNEMEITAGKVGIGVTSPNEKLEVAGKIRANTAFNVNGTDGITQTINILDKNNVRHTLVYTGGILTSYSTS
jgi:hypothetical protein